jgi:dihydroorotase
MKLLIKQVTIVDSSSPHNGKIKDVLIENGIIHKIGDANSITGEADKTFDGKEKHLSIGWFDLHARFCEPGFEYKEDLVSGCRAAAAGGFTGVLCMPSTHPPVQSKSEIEFITNKTKNEVTEVFSSGVLSVNSSGKDLSEMYDMSQAGALAFTDDKKPVQDAGLLLRALMYAKNFNGLVMSYANDSTISVQGQMNEGITSTQLGLKGIPALAENTMINRDLFLAEYAESKIHFSTISSAKSVELIRDAKKKGLNVTCDVAAHQLLLDDSLLNDFDTNYKVKPPLRTKEDIEALKQGLIDGTIDAICSDHSPEDVENKKKEFDLAEFGIIALETAFAVANTALEKTISPVKFIEKFTVNPRVILSVPVPVFKEGEPANLTLFDFNAEWKVEAHHFKSKSRNTPFIGTTLKGRPIAAFNKGQVIEC